MAPPGIAGFNCLRSEDETITLRQQLQSLALLRLLVYLSFLSLSPNRYSRFCPRCLYLSVYISLQSCCQSGNGPLYRKPPVYGKDLPGNKLRSITGQE